MRRPGYAALIQLPFIKVLELVKTFPDEADYGDYNSEEGMQGTQFSNNEALLDFVYLYGYNQMRDIVSSFGGDVTFVGFPVPEGMGSSIVPSLEIAISSKTELPEVCWSFIKYLLSDEFQSNLIYTLPLMKSKLDKMAQEALTDIVASSSDMTIMSSSSVSADAVGIDEG